MPRDDGEYESDLEHWSSPDGCHDNCPACEDERTPEESADHTARLRVALYAPELLAALKWLLDDLTDSGENRNAETGEEFDSCANAREAIAKATEAP